MDDPRFSVFQPYLPLLVDGGFLCSTCQQVRPTYRCAPRSMGQCDDCWEQDPVAVPCHADWAVYQAVRREEKY